MIGHPLAGIRARFPDGLHARFGASLCLLQAAVSPRARNSSWIAEVRRVVAKLELLNRSTEADFLSVGGNLMAFFDSSRQLHAELDCLTSLVSGEHVQRACEALLSVRDYVEKARRSSEERSHALTTLQSSADSIHRSFSTLGQVATSFQITAILARIEAAHLVSSQHEMGNLADEVQASSDSIKAHSQSVMEAAQSLKGHVASTFRQMSSVDASQRQALLSLLSAVDRDVQAFQSRQQTAMAESARLSSAVNTVNRELGEISTSIQAHDITRQQVEHVVEALNSLIAGAPRRALSLSEANIVKMQAAQLQSAAANFTRSTAEIDSDLAKIAARVDEMATSSKGILGYTGKSDESAFDDMRKRLEEIVRTVGHSKATANSSSAILADLNALSHSLRSSVKDVKAVELRLSRIAINGAISAHHIGIEGEPLAVVAAAMQTLQMECAARLLDAEQDLSAIGRVISSLSESGLPSSAAGYDDLLMNNLNDRLNELNTAESSSGEISASVARIAADLGRELQFARDHAAIGSLFGATVQESCGVLDSAASQAEPLWFAPLTEASNDLADRYTMQSERDIHNKVTNGNEPAPAAVNTGEMDDVEFF